MTTAEETGLRAGRLYLIGVDVEPQRDNLTLAMLVDTIIKAATQLAVSMENAPLAIPYGSAAARATMRKLVKDAGLLDEH